MILIRLNLSQTWLDVTDRTGPRTINTEMFQANFPFQ